MKFSSPVSQKVPFPNVFVVSTVTGNASRGSCPKDIPKPKSLESLHVLLLFEIFGSYIFTGSEDKRLWMGNIGSGESVTVWSCFYKHNLSINYKHSITKNNKCAVIIKWV